MATKPKVAELTPEAQRIFKRIQREWNIRDEAGRFLLTRAMECFDRLRQAQEILAKEGIIATDRFGQAKPHPACQVEKEARGHLLQCFKSLNLDLESLEVDDDAA